MSKPGMPRADAVFAAMSTGAIAFVVAFVAPLFVPLAVPWYYPVERRWSLEIKPTGLAMDFYGRIVFGVIAWSLTVTLTLLVARRVTALNARLRGLLLAWAITAALFTMFYFTWTLLYRVPTPEPIPSWYTPR